MANFYDSVKNMLDAENGRGFVHASSPSPSYVDYNIIAIPAKLSVDNLHSICNVVYILILLMKTRTLTVLLVSCALSALFSSAAGLLEGLYCGRESCYDGIKSL